MKSEKKTTSKYSSNDGKHPYLIDSKWVDGTLCFWRESPGMYSKETIQKFEEGIKKLREKANKYIAI